MSIGTFVLSTKKGLNENHGYETATDLVTIRQDGMAGWWWVQILARWNYRITRTKLHGVKWKVLRLTNSKSSVATVPRNVTRKLVGTP